MYLSCQVLDEFLLKTVCFLYFTKAKRFVDIVSAHNASNDVYSYVYEGKYRRILIFHSY